MFLGLALFAGVVKLVDALDSKSSFPCGSVGSIPTSGTTKCSKDDQIVKLHTLNPDYDFIIGVFFSSQFLRIPLTADSI